MIFAMTFAADGGQRTTVPEQKNDVFSHGKLPSESSFGISRIIFNYNLIDVLADRQNNLDIFRAAIQHLGSRLKESI